MLVMMIGTVAGPLIGAGISALGSLLGGERANVQTREMAREQMDFQREMSNTSYQRAVQDMELAGINPMLAIGQGGASTPGGASATMQDVISPAISSAQQARRISSELTTMRENQNLIRKQAEKAAWEARVAENTEEMTNMQNRRYFSENQYMLTPRIGMLGVDTPFEQVATGRGNPLWRNLEQQYSALRIANEVSSAQARRSGLTGSLGNITLLAKGLRDFFTQPIGGRR